MRNWHNTSLSPTTLYFNRLHLVQPNRHDEFCNQNKSTSLAEGMVGFETVSSDLIIKNYFSITQALNSHSTGSDEFASYYTHVTYRT